MSDSGSIVVGWLTRLVVVFAVLGFLFYDGVAITISNVGAADDATTAASAAADAYVGTHNVQSAYDAAVKAIADKPDQVETKTFQVTSDGTVTLTVDRHPTTLWMQRIGPTRGMTHVSQSGTGKPGS